MPDIRAEYRIVNRCFLVLLLAALMVPWTVYIPEIPETRAAWRWRPPGSACMELTGKPCSSTGLTRSVVAFYRGNPKAALAYNPGGIVFVFLLFFQLALRWIPERVNIKWIPMVDLGQMILTELMFSGFLKIQ